jgi:hypothetical protein
MLKGDAVPGNASDAVRATSQSKASPGRVRTNSGHIRIVAPSKVLVVEDDKLLENAYAQAKEVPIMRPPILAAKLSPVPRRCMG